MSTHLVEKIQEPDTNENIHDYRIRSSIQSDIKHIPKNLFNALSATDKPIKKEEMVNISSDLITSHQSKNLSKKHPTKLVAKESKSKDNEIHLNPKLYHNPNMNPNSDDHEMNMKKKTKYPFVLNCGLYAMIGQFLIFLITIAVIVGLIVWIKKNK